MADHPITDTLIDPSRIQGSVSDETRHFMSQMVEFADPHPNPLPPAPVRLTGLTGTAPRPPTLSMGTLSSVSQPSQTALPAPRLDAIPGIPPQLSSIMPSLMTLMGRILEELEMNLPKLLSLNPSRRISIAQHLERLAGQSQTSQAAQLDPTAKLRRWIEGPRSTPQNAALRTYFEEVAVIALGQAILLKNWSDRGVRKWNDSDLGRLNWALSTALRPHLPLDREGWHLTRPNLYSWYNPGAVVQGEVWRALDAWKLGGEGPHLLISLLNPLRKAQPEIPETHGYDPRFYQMLWGQMPIFGFNPRPEAGGLKRCKSIFTPTLRDGSLVRTAPSTLTWVGLEASPFQLMMSELMQIWWGPAAPPLWSIGTGLEVHARDQLAFSLSSPKPSILSRIAEMEACEAAIVQEEQIVRTQGRSLGSVRFKEQLEGLPYFKKLRTSGTSLGDLQACVAITKVRPGGLFWWAREEALSVKDGQEVLNFLLDRSKLVCEWDFTELEHSLPAALPLYPKHLYLFQREGNLEVRLSHRPVRHSIQGQLRSHVELPHLLSEAFQSAHRPSQNKGNWKILSHTSPTPQRDWLEKWPDPTSHSVIRELDELRTASLPLANFTTIRHTPECNPAHGNGWSVQQNLRGLWISAEFDTDGRKLTARPLPRPGQEVKGSGYLVLVSDESWVAPLSTYLMSARVQQWLDQNAERRGDRWILNEQVVKWIPIPKRLLQALHVPCSQNEEESNSFALPLPGEWEGLASEASHNPTKVKEALEKLSAQPDVNGSQEIVHQIHAALFVRSSRAFDYIRSGQNRLLSLVTPDGRIKWRDLLDTLPKTESVTISLHPRVRMSGSLPPHLPIERMDRVKSPTPGILLATESGFSLHISSDAPLLLTLLWEQLEGLTHPTWNELLNYLRVPRKLELAETTAFEVLRSHGEQMNLLKDLSELIKTCKLF